MATKTRQSTIGVNPNYFKNELMLDLFLEWANANPSLFKSKYPELSNTLTKEINSCPEILAATIEKLPELFPKWLDKANRLIGSSRIAELKRIISTLELFLNKVYDNEIVEHSRRKMESAAEEYLCIVVHLIEQSTQEPSEIGFKLSQTVQIDQS